MILMKDAIFCDPREDLVLPVVDLTYSDGKAVLDTKHFYLIGDLIWGQILRSRPYRRNGRRL